MAIAVPRCDTIAASTFESADVGQSAAGEHDEPGVGPAQHRHVERSRTQVVDEGVVTDRNATAGDRLEPVGGRDRFPLQTYGRQHRRDGGEQHRAPPPPTTPAGDDGLGDRCARHPGRFEGDLADDGTDQPVDRDLVLAEQHHAVVDAPLRVRLEALRVGLCLMHGVPPTTSRPVGSRQTTEGSRGDPSKSSGRGV
ncbi:hypothetical protein O7632_21950 [Solwaraspora sp. WMMD406]|uniref:hypothetical protein n=1 Tax=Solwaraspora sp. WMMD406 TaxID=3016095 RepID=UPI00241719D5|nr:hypothetical protein [Solwaraspora sp. WMMD406]MDG4766740.1 hypothetical protein [Solwaraspora sp. WMMD406]